VPELERLLDDMPVDQRAMDRYQRPGFRETLLHGVKSQRECNVDSNHEEEELMHIPGWVLSRCVAYLDLGDCNSPVEPLQVAGQLLLFIGGRISKSPYEEAVTHVIVSKSNLSRVKVLRAEIAQRIAEKPSGKVPWVVSEGWVEECVRERTWVDEGRWVL